MNDRYVQFFKSGAMVNRANPQPVVDGHFSAQPKPSAGLKRIENMTQQELIEASSDPAMLQDLIDQIIALE